MKRKNLWLLFAAALIASPLAFVACGDDEEVACETSDDCSAGEACIDSVCRTTCTDNDDCASGECANNCDEEAFCYEPCTSDDECGEGTCEDFCNGRRKMCKAAPGLTTCTDDAECGDGEICDEDGEICIMGCREDDQCPEGEVCNPVALGCEPACENDGQCDEDAGEQCVDGHCVTPDNTCEEHAECTERPAYCAEDGDAAGTCVDVSCGSAGNTCGKCTDGANGGKGADNGPVIFNARVSCNTDATGCPDAGTYRCDFSFDAFDPGNDLKTSDFVGDIVRVDGSTPQTWGSKYQDGTYTFVGGCFGDNNVETKHSTVYLKNQSGLASNTLCF